MPITEVVSLMNVDDSGSELVTFAQQTADKLVRSNLTRAQIRTIFTEVRQIEAQWPSAGALRRLNMLKPKLAYQAKRNSSVDYLYLVLSDAINEVTKASQDSRNERFQRFVDLFEAILAYHHALGGKKS
jgi:CRISPR-associated protein Csm2